MSPYELLDIGIKYSKKDLSEVLNQPNLEKVREGIYSCTNSDSMLFFVDLEKSGKADRFHFDDFYDGDYFHWDSQTTQHIDSPRIQKIVKGDVIPHLFVRVNPKIKSITQPFIYCGRLMYDKFEKNTSKPVHLRFISSDYDDMSENQDLLEIYSWKPEKIGRTSKTTLLSETKVSEKRKARYKEPNETERRGLVTTRVGQGYYRQEIIERWNGKCPITGCSIIPILIASHIKRWSDSNHQEKLDVNNGILLSPNVDSLFDKHLISFASDGSILVSDSISKLEIEQLGIIPSKKLPITEEMKPYLDSHRGIFENKTKSI